MTYEISRLEKEILHKNLLLNAVLQSENTSRERVSTIKSELDRLLYQYYKLLKYC